MDVALWTVFAMAFWRRHWSLDDILCGCFSDVDYGKIMRRMMMRMLFPGDEPSLVILYILWSDVFGLFDTYLYVFLLYRSLW